MVVRRATRFGTPVRRTISKRPRRPSKPTTRSPVFISRLSGAVTRTPKVVTFRPTGRRVRSGEGLRFVRGARGKIKGVRPRPIRATRVTVSSPRSILAKSIRRKDRRPDIFRTGARGKKVKIKRGRPTRSPPQGRPIPRPIPRPTFVSNLIPFQAEPPIQTRGQIRSRQTPASRQAGGFATFDELGQLGLGLKEVGRRIGDTTVREIVEGLPIVAVGKKISKTKFKSDDPLFSEFGSDFDVLNFFG